MIEKASSSQVNKASVTHNVQGDIVGTKGDTSSPKSNALLKDTKSSFRVGKQKVTGNGTTSLPIGVLEGFANYPSAIVRETLARRPEIGMMNQSVQMRIAADEGWVVGRTQRGGTIGLSLSPNTPSHLLKRIYSEAKPSDFAVLHNLASNPKTPADILSALATGGRTYLYGVAGNSSAPVSLLNTLSEHSDALMRSVVASNPSTPVATLEKMADVGGGRVLSAIAGNPNTPVSLYSKLIKNSEGLGQDYVLRNLASKPSLPSSIAEFILKREDLTMAKVNLAGNASVSMAVLDALMNDTEGLVRQAAIKNPRASMKQINKFVHSQDVYSRRGVSTNNRLKPEWVKKLSKDSDLQVVQNIAQYQTLPKEMMTDFATHFSKDIRASVAKNQSLSIAFKKRLAEDGDEGVRISLAQNMRPPVTKEIVEKLAGDASEEVIGALLSNPYLNFR